MPQIGQAQERVLWRAQALIRSYKDKSSKHGFYAKPVGSIAINPLLRWRVGWGLRDKLEKIGFATIA